MEDDTEFIISDAQKKDVIDLQARMKALIPHLMTITNLDLTTADPPTWNVVGDELLFLVCEEEFAIVERSITSLTKRLKKGE